MKTAGFRRHAAAAFIVLVVLLFGALIGTTWCLVLTITPAYPFAIGICVTLIILIAGVTLALMGTQP